MVYFTTISLALALVLIVLLVRNNGGPNRPSVIAKNLKEKTVYSDDNYTQTTSITLAALLLAVFWPLAVLVYSVYKIRQNSQWRKGTRIGLMTLMSVMLIWTNIAWADIFSDTDGSESAQNRESVKQSQQLKNASPNTENPKNVSGPIDNSTTHRKEDNLATSTSGQEKVNSTTNNKPTSGSQELSTTTKTTENGQQNATQNNDSNLQNADNSSDVEADEQKQTLSQSNRATVESVVDGDTVRVQLSNGQTEVLRLIGIDTPETQHPSKPVQCFGKEAARKAREVLNGEEIELEYDQTQGKRDKYGRLLTYIKLPDGTNFNKMMIEDGYAYEYTYNTPYKYQDEFKEAERSARENDRGLWAEDTCGGQRAIDSSEDSDTSNQDDATQENNGEKRSASGGKWYASSHHWAEYYYHESCDEWKDLSDKYLQIYNSEAAAQEDNPDYQLHPDCEVE